MPESILSLQDLTISVIDNGREKNIVEALSLDIPTNKIFALVGGSGSGKTTIGLAVLRLLPPALRLKQGKIFFKGQNLLEYSPSQMRKVRGKEIGMIF